MAASRRLLIAFVGGALLGGCAAPDSGSTAPSGQPERSILASSAPAPGSTVAGPVDELELHFAPPARLDEVTVSGPDGVMPTMIHAIGEVADYSIPLPGLGPGAYTVNWRATAKGANYRGSFAFIVRS